MKIELELFEDLSTVYESDFPDEESEIEKLKEEALWTLKIEGKEIGKLKTFDQAMKDLRFFLELEDSGLIKSETDENKI